MRHADEVIARWEVERDRFGVSFSGPLQVGECIEVVPASEVERLREALERIDQRIGGAEATDPYWPLIEWVQGEVRAVLNASDE